MQGLWACGLVIIFRDFDTILNLTTLIMVFLSMMTISSVFVLRLRHGHAVAGDDDDLVRLFEHEGRIRRAALLVGANQVRVNP